MAVEIIQIKVNAKYEINGKLIYKDQMGNWLCHNELLPIEKEAFKRLAALKFKDSSVKEKIETAC